MREVRNCEVHRLLPKLVLGSLKAGGGVQNGYMRREIFFRLNEQTIDESDGG